MERFIAVLSVVLGLSLIGSVSAQVVAPPGGGEEQKLTDLTPLVGTWKGWFKSQTAADVPMEMTVQADGAYSGVIYFRPRPESYSGNFSIEEGGIKAATSKGLHQTYWLYVVKGKRVLTHNRPGVGGQQWYRDTELEWVK
jgi:hypothetical protein